MSEVDEVVTRTSNQISEPLSWIIRTQLILFVQKISLNGRIVVSGRRILKEASLYNMLNLMA